MLIANPEEWIGKTIGEYKLQRILGNGRIGYVYLASHKLVPQLKRAYKIIASGQLKNGWEREIVKVGQLSSCPEVANVQDFGAISENNKFTYIAYDYVDGINLKEYIKKSKNDLSISLILSILTALLKVHYACQKIGFKHGDLHEGNILVSKPDELDPFNDRRIIITDFGYGGSHNALAPKEDINQIAQIGCNLLNALNRDKLQASERIIKERVLNFLRKNLIETYRMAGTTHTENDQTVLHEFNDCVALAKREAAASEQGMQLATSPDDYLNAETLGYRVAEWQNLFVPEILGEPAFVARNVTVITGARGCGKTMAFRRLTLYLDELIGEKSGIQGSDTFVGFYMNCRDLVEAFPYVPKRTLESKTKQIRHFFHLCWLQDIVKGFQQRAIRDSNDYRWLVNWAEKIFNSKIEMLWTRNSDCLIALAHFIENEKEVCAKMSRGKQVHWALEDSDVLDKLYEICEKNLEWISNRPFYFYLDDYTIPLISQYVQAILNPIVFKRRPNIIFKISTEATNSFLRKSDKKPLEINHDFDFVDLASETLSMPEDKKVRLLSGILSRRLRRIKQFENSTHDLREILGEGEWKSFNELARRIRDKKHTAEQNYSGHRAFVGMWSSDIRSMIQIFNELLRFSINDNIYQIPITASVQHRRYSESGGEFLNVTESLRDGGFWDDESVEAATPKQIGRALKDVAHAFISVCKYELMEGKEINNQGNIAPKQAIRIEIIDEFNLSNSAKSIYLALLRWHVFLPDWRGRSVRGFMVPRLFLNRRLIPYGRLSYSGHDSISLRSSEFEQLLIDPQNFERYWRTKAIKNKGNNDPQLDLT